MAAGALRAGRCRRLTLIACVAVGPLALTDPVRAVGSWPPRSSDGGQHIENEFLSDDAWLQRQPRVTWNKDWGKCCLLMLDPDAPKPFSEQIGGHRCGALGPWLHWLVVDAVGTPEQVSRFCA